MTLHRNICNFANWGRIRRQRLIRRFVTTNAGQWKPTVGLEIHAQIATKSKLFSGASTSFGSPNNTCVSLFDSAIPGTMPVLNRKCVEAGVLTALALSCELNEVSMFERKHYFYADLPAGFQITQQKKPLAINGEITFPVFTPGIHKKPYYKSSKIKQLQLEQDSGKSLHDGVAGRSLIDLNRAGIPLMELVFEPDLADGEEAAALVKELAFILELLGTCSCKMEEGALRVDANVSIGKPNEPLGVRTELKNIGSVRAVASAIRYEINRQISILRDGGQIFNETRAWDTVNKKTVPMREKEERQDYRFMPETNLPPLHLHIDENVENEENLVSAVSLREGIPDLPGDIRDKMQNGYGIRPEIVVAMMSDPMLFHLLQSLIEDKKDRNPKLIAQFLVNEGLSFLHKHNFKVSYYVDKIQFIGELIDLLESKTINLLLASKIMDQSLIDVGIMPKQIVEKHNWYQMTDEKEMERICLMIINRSSKLVKRYKAGKTKELNGLMSQFIKVTDCKADMKLATQVMKRLLE